jgi:hypothetical protein
MVPGQLAGDLDAVHPRQTDVQEDDVRVKLVDQRKSDLARAGVTHHLQVRVGLEDPAGAIAVQGVVIDHDDTDDLGLHGQQGYACSQPETGGDHP